MSIWRCDIHGSYDTDFHEYCPKCEPRGERIDLASEVEERAQKAEAQVCQLKAEVERLQKEDEAGDKVIDDLGNDIERLINERDAARAKAEKWKALVIQTIEDCDETTKEYEAMERQLEEALNSMGQLQLALNEAKGKMYRFACSDHRNAAPKSIYCSTCGKPMSKPGKGKVKELEALEGTCPRCGMEQVKVGGKDG